MSKSLGNLYTLEDLAKRGYTPTEVRYVLISGHYHTPLNFTLHSLDSAKQGLQKLAKADKALNRGTALAPTGPGPFAEGWQMLLHDLNVPGALGVIFGVLNKTKAASLSDAEATEIRAGLHFMLQSLGLVLPTIAEESTAEVPEDIQALAQQRWDAKQAKDWSSADALRKQLEAAGWIIKDSKEGFSVVKA